MIFNDGVQTDDEMRAKFCPRCKNEKLSTHADYCKICGLRLYNYCLGETITDPNGNHPDWIEYHKNDSDARFCEKCGTETIFFEQGLLRTWEDIKNEKETNDFEVLVPNDDIPF